MTLGTIRMATMPDQIGQLNSPITVDEWAALEGAPYELIDGCLREKPPVALWHDILLVDLLRFLANYVDTNSIGKLVAATTPLRISIYHGRKPDIFLIPKSMYSFVGKNLFTGVPPLVIEILSPSSEREDRIQKRKEYASLGIAQYWIVDFPSRCIEVYELQDPDSANRGYQLVQSVSGEEIFRPAMFPGLEIPLAKIWPTAFETREVD